MGDKIANTLPGPKGKSLLSQDGWPRTGSSTAAGACSTWPASLGSPQAAHPWTCGAAGLAVPRRDSMWEGSWSRSDLRGNYVRSYETGRTGPGSGSGAGKGLGFTQDAAQSLLTGTLHSRPALQVSRAHEVCSGGVFRVQLDWKGLNEWRVLSGVGVQVIMFLYLTLLSSSNPNLLSSVSDQRSRCHLQGKRETENCSWAEGGCQGRTVSTSDYWNYCDH
jgi:hypothetical protein